MQAIQTCLDYLDTHLTEPVTLPETAAMLGYSEGHFAALFHQETGLSFMSYLRSRRLQYAIFDISQGANMLDVAVRYGYSTYAGFYRAFVRDYRMSPTRFLETAHPRRPERINLSETRPGLPFSHQELDQLLQGYDLSLASRDIHPVIHETGIPSTDTYAIGDNLLLYVAPLPGPLMTHASLCTSLSVHGVRAAIPMPDRNGNTVSSLGQNWYLLVRQPDGIPLSSSQLFASAHLTAPAFHFGEAIGRLDQALCALNDTDLEPLEDMDLVETVCHALDSLPPSLSLPLSASQYRTQFAPLCAHLTTQPIHRNMHPSCVLWTGNDYGFSDFRLSCLGVRLWDPLYAATGILSEHFTDTEACMTAWCRLLEDLLAGYDTLAALTQDERMAVPYVLYGIQCICLAFFHGKDTYHQLFEINLRMTIRIAEAFHLSAS